MSESKELLEATVKGLKEKLEQLQTELNVKTLQLNNVNKPKLNQSTMDIIYDCIDEGIEEYDFTDVDVMSLNLNLIMKIKLLLEV